MVVDRRDSRIGQRERRSRLPPRIEPTERWTGSGRPRRLRPTGPVGETSCRSGGVGGDPPPRLRGPAAPAGPLPGRAMGCPAGQWAAPGGAFGAGSTPTARQAVAGRSPDIGGRVERGRLKSHTRGRAPRSHDRNTSASVLLRSDVDRPCIFRAGHRSCGMVARALSSNGEGGIRPSHDTPLPRGGASYRAVGPRIGRRAGLLAQMHAPSDIAARCPPAGPRPCGTITRHARSGAWTRSPAIRFAACGPVSIQHPQDTPRRVAGILPVREAGTAVVQCRILIMLQHMIASLARRVRGDFGRHAACHDVDYPARWIGGDPPRVPAALRRPVSDPRSDHRASTGSRGGSCDFVSGTDAPRTPSWHAAIHSVISGHSIAGSERRRRGCDVPNCREPANGGA